MNISNNKLNALLFCMLQRAIQEDKVDEYINVCTSICTRTRKADAEAMKSVLMSNFNRNLGKTKEVIG